MLFIVQTTCLIRHCTDDTFVHLFSVHLGIRRLVLTPILDCTRSSSYYEGSRVIPSTRFFFVRMQAVKQLSALENHASVLCSEKNLIRLALLSYPLDQATFVMVRSVRTLYVLTIYL